MMKIYLVIVLTVAALWDGLTTIYGTVQVLGDGSFQLVASVLFSALIMGFVLNTTRIMRWSKSQGFLGMLTGFFWFIALCYDFYTSWLGNADLLVGKSGRPAEIIILIGLTLLVIASPILLSMMWERGFSTRARKEVVS